MWAEQQEDQRMRAEDNAKNAEMAQMRQKMSNMENAMHQRAQEERARAQAEAKAAADQHAAERDDLMNAAMAAGANARELHQLNAQLNRQQIVLKMEQDHADQAH